MYEAIETMVGHECRFNFAWDYNFELPTSAVSVWRRKDGRFAKRVYAFFHAWYRVGVTIGYCVKSWRKTVQFRLFGDCKSAVSTYLAF